MFYIIYFDTTYLFLPALQNGTFNIEIYTTFLKLFLCLSDSRD